jgi:transmembrane sensor
MSVAQHIDTAILDQAAAWLVRLNASDVSGEDRADWQRWHDQSPQHARAWQRAEALLSRLGGLPPALTRPVLGRDHDAMRRRVVTRLAALLAVAPVAWSAWRMGPEWTADYRTATGERRDIRLADGSAVMLNTATALDVRFDTSQRRLYLLSGEILIDTASDAQIPARPFLVDSAQGRMRALGTRFLVRQFEKQTELTVLQGAVEIRLHETNTPGLVVQAGEKTRFGPANIAPVQAAAPESADWSRGMLVADAMSLRELAAELSRYRRGVLRVDPAVAALLVSGAFPIDDTERCLVMLQSTYPLRLEFVTRYWVNLAAR